MCVKHLTLLIYIKSKYHASRLLVVFVFSSEDGEVYVAFRMLLEVDHQRVGVRYSCIKTIVQSRVVKEQAYSAVLAVEFCCHVVHVAQRLVNLLLCRSEVERSEVVGERCGVIKNGVCLGHHCWHVLVEGAHQCVQLYCRCGEV